jgi:hypothetical protein
MDIGLIPSEPLYLSSFHMRSKNNAVNVFKQLQLPSPHLGYCVVTRRAGHILNSAPSHPGEMTRIKNQVGVSQVVKCSSDRVLA